MLAGCAKLPPVILHASGALSSQALAELAKRGVHTGSAHPMMTFVAGEPPSLKGAVVCFRGQPAGAADGACHRSQTGRKKFHYRAWRKASVSRIRAMLSPMLATELAAAEKIGLRAGIGARMCAASWSQSCCVRYATYCATAQGSHSAGRLPAAMFASFGRTWSHSAPRLSPRLPGIDEYACEMLPVQRAAR